LIRIFNGINQTKNKVVFIGYNLATKVEQENKVFLLFSIEVQLYEYVPTIRDRTSIRKTMKE